MLDKKYKICLLTPLGNRGGTLYINIGEGAANGCLEVMNHKNPILDLMLSDGSISFSGEIESLVSKTEYTAAGTICERKILINLKTSSGIYSVSGEEISIDEEIL